MGVADARHANWSDGAHLAQDVREAGVERNLNLLLPVRELRVGRIQVHEVVKGEWCGCYSDNCAG